MSANIDILSNASILVVDDTPANLSILSAMLKEKGYEVRPVPNGKLALQAARNKLPNLILLDINMPEMDGYEVCEQLKSDQVLRNIPVIFISALSETIDKVKAFSVGGIDYITKPLEFEEVQARVETHLKLQHLMTNLENTVAEQVKEISESQIATIVAMAKLTQSRDDSTGKHLDRIQAYCRVLTKKLSENPKFTHLLDEANIEMISRASTLHDIGKVGIQDNILLKKGRLTSEEYEIMKQHSITGARTLEKVKKYYPRNQFVNTGIEIARSHHEKWDGTGYPDGLSKTDIPLSARIMSVADVYDAIKSKRCYKAEMPHMECYKIILNGNGSFFDPDIVNAFHDTHMELYEIWNDMH